MKRRTKKRLKNLVIDLVAFALTPFYWITQKQPFIFGVISLVVFMFDIEYDRDIFTWIFLWNGLGLIYTSHMQVVKANASVIVTLKKELEQIKKTLNR